MTAPSHLLLPNRVRRLFFETIDKLRPQVHESLREKVQPVFKEMLAVLRANGRLDPVETWNPKAWNPPPEFPEYDPTPIWHLHFLLRIHPGRTLELGELLDRFVNWYDEGCAAGDVAITALQEALREWADQYNLNTQWVIATVLSTLWTWEGAYYPYQPVQEGWFIPKVLRQPRASESETEGYWVELPELHDLTIQSPVEIRDSHLNELKRVLESHLKKLERQAEQRRISLVGPGGTAHHVEWLVRYQIPRSDSASPHGESYVQIAKDSGADRSSVTEAVNRLREYLDLPERPRSPGGRPRG